MTKDSKSLFSGVKWTFMSSASVAASRFLLVFLIAHYLSKAEMGLLAIIWVVLGLSQYFVEAGIGSAVIHRQTDDRRELGTANLINISLGFIVGISIFIIAKPLAEFYDNDKLTIPLQTLAIPLFIQGLTIQYTSLLKRDLKFDVNAKIEIANSFSNVLCTALFLIKGFGVYAVVFGSIASMTVKLLLLLASLYRSYGFPVSYDKNSFSFYLSYGGYSIGQSVLNYVNREIDVFILGRTINIESLGLYYLLKQVVFAPTQLISMVITNIALPVFARAQADIKSLTDWFVYSSKSLSVIYSLFYGCLLIFAHEIFENFFNTSLNEQAVFALIFLCYFSAIRAIGHPVGSLLMATGKARQGFYWNLITVLVMPLAVYVGSFYDFTGVALASLTATVMLVFPSWQWILRRMLSVNFGHYVRSLYIPLMQSIVVVPVILYFDVGIIIRLGLCGVLLVSYFVQYRSLFTDLLARRI